MNNFQTVVSVSPWQHKIALSDGILTIGSCFADSMGSRLASNKIKVLSNPFGILYNPISIQKALRYSIFNEAPPAHTFLRSGEVYVNYDFHSELSSLEETTLPVLLREIIGTTHYFLAGANWLIMTFGTAWVYERRDTGEIVANCHKISGDAFAKRLLTEQEIVDSFDIFYRDLLATHPNIKVILSVSPVRHTKDTLELNSVSKSILRTVCFHITKKHQQVDYFPAYEIMLDELRDYRFYKADLIHPSEVAEDYIWEKFGDRYFTTDLRLFIERWSMIQRAVSHKSFHPSTLAHQLFLRETLQKLEELKPLVNVDDEVALLKSQLLE